MALETGFVRIFEGDQDLIDAITKPRLVVAIHLDKGQSVREIETTSKNPPKQNSPMTASFLQPRGRKFR
jgi:hypothetical protein